MVVAKVGLDNFIDVGIKNFVIVTIFRNKNKMPACATIETVKKANQSVEIGEFLNFDEKID